MSAWTFFWCSLASPDFAVGGISFSSEIFKRFEDSKEIVDVKLPIYGTDHKYRVYRYMDANRIFRIASSECTPGVYIAYADESTRSFCAPQYKWDAVEKWVRAES